MTVDDKGGGRRKGRNISDIKRLFPAKKEGENSLSFLIHRTISGTLALSTLLAYINFYNLFGLLQNEGKK